MMGKYWLPHLSYFEAWIQSWKEKNIQDQEASNNTYALGQGTQTCMACKGLP